MSFLRRNFSVPISILVAIFFYIEDQNILISLACLLIAIFWISYDFLQK